MLKPNHICKYSKCDLGTDENGNPCRKHYYACDYCDRTANWKSMACCFEHYQLYMEEVVHNRSLQTESLLPERTDLTVNETQKLMQEPIESVKERTKKELLQYTSEDESINIEKAVNKINEEIDNHVSKTKANKKNQNNRKK